MLGDVRISCCQSYWRHTFLHELFPTLWFFRQVFRKRFGHRTVRLQFVNDPEQVLCGDMSVALHMGLQSGLGSGSQGVPCSDEVKLPMCGFWSVLSREGLRRNVILRHCAPASLILCALMTAVAPKQHFEAIGAREPLMPNGQGLTINQTLCPILFCRKEGSSAIEGVLKLSWGGGQSLSRLFFCFARASPARLGLWLRLCARGCCHCLGFGASSPFPSG